jgi:hypothetical protein
MQQENRRGLPPRRERLILSWTDIDNALILAEGPALHEFVKLIVASLIPKGLFFTQKHGLNLAYDKSDHLIHFWEDKGTLDAVHGMSEDERFFMLKNFFVQRKSFSQMTTAFFDLPETVEIIDGANHRLWRLPRIHENVRKFARLGEKTVVDLGLAYHFA